MTVTLLFRDLMASLSISTDPEHVSSCLASSTYFSITKTYVFGSVNLLFCVWTHRVHSLKSISGPWSIEEVYPLSCARTSVGTQDVSRRVFKTCLQDESSRRGTKFSSHSGQIYKTSQDSWGHLLWSQDVTRRFHTQPPPIM